MEIVTSIIIYHRATFDNFGYPADNVIAAMWLILEEIEDFST